jgi:hypothetical protein
MRKPDSDVPEKLRREYQRPHSDTSVVSILFIALICWVGWEMLGVSTIKEKAYQEGWKAALNTKEVHPDLENTCLTLWWGQNARNP